MISLKLSQIANALNGRLVGDELTIDNVSTDTRAIGKGDLFVALKGLRFDAHEFAGQAVSDGAVALVVDHELDLPVPQIVVTDTRIALGDLGALVRRSVNPQVVAITGSTGKTTVKEMTAAILAEQGQVLATQGNFNNDIGVPLTLLRLTEDDQFAVIELGANHIGEIAYTVGLTAPDVAVITNAGASHLEGFGSLHGVVRAKGEILNGIEQGGNAVLNFDSPDLAYWQGRCGEHPVLGFSIDKPDATVFATDIDFDNEGRASFILNLPAQQAQVHLTVPGEHNVSNAMAAAAACYGLGIDAQTIANGLGHMTSVKGRLNVYHPSDDIRLIDDTYNANEASVKAAIKLLARYPGEKVLVLGDMKELGAQAKELHEGVGVFAQQQGISALYAVGELSGCAAGRHSNGHHFNDKARLVDALRELLNQGRPTTVLVKGSRSSNMDKVVADLLQRLEQEKEMIGVAGC
ncbi:UDP-N-acetylmuramoyl-tripeptide--D-alanyl-D-alanine ligase [Corallincola spongiicola]|uniref:UDP-N-acetylmuramoyl-tripeptide--D-alanyl-D-alanine ligase n=1 Tax=Corallincola spongiicola TaxID=2520508 RepID=A0ABY1WNL1_9GAMM|nr:UDP-N-acetylmuramoyl-tripeptide--D-alanyl-D-alanine ligase [Corallincola spongiicola]TAA45139.1 UDP-N-acetylmuramoyl-tripeptide--D-alanyl-D-alanine ligase [Corallincola spongiicola]